MAGLYRNRWWVVFAMVCGPLVGAGPINVFTFGVFLKPITEDLGLSRGAFSAALLAAGCLIFSAAGALSVSGAGAGPVRRRGKDPGAASATSGVSARIEKV